MRCARCTPHTRACLYGCSHALMRMWLCKSPGCSMVPCSAAYSKDAVRVVHAVHGRHPHWLLSVTLRGSGCAINRSLSDTSIVTDHRKLPLVMTHHMSCALCSNGTYGYLLQADNGLPGSYSLIHADGREDVRQSSGALAKGLAAVGATLLLFGCAFIFADHQTGATSALYVARATPAVRPLGYVLPDGPHSASELRAQKDPNAPKRPMTGYLYYVNEKRPDAVAKNPDKKVPLALHWCPVLQHLSSMPPPQCHYPVLCCPPIHMHNCNMGSIAACSSRHCQCICRPNM